MPSEYRDLTAFLISHDLGEYVDTFFDKGMRVGNFHKLDAFELSKMRVTNTSLVRKLLQLANRRVNLKVLKKMKSDQQQQVKNKHRKTQKSDLDPNSTANTMFSSADNDVVAGREAFKGSETPPLPPTQNNSTMNSGRCHHQHATDPTANQCVRNAMVYIPPSPMKRQSIVEGYRELKHSMWHGGDPNMQEHSHSHGHQAGNCSVCSELNLAAGRVEDRVRSVRKEQYPFPEPGLHNPQYPIAVYDYALQFRLLQLSIDVAEMQQHVWDEELKARNVLISVMIEHIEREFEKEQNITIRLEQQFRSKVDQSEIAAWKEILSLSVNRASNIALNTREQNYRELLFKQCICLSHVESYERQCVEAESESEVVHLIEIGAHLYHLTIREHRQRSRELDTLDYKSRCPTCWKRKCSFFRHPWKVWSSRHGVVKECSRDSDASTSGIIRKGSFFKDHVIPTSRTVKILTGRCHGVSVVSEYKKLEMHSHMLSAASKKKLARSLPSTLRSVLSGSSSSPRRNRNLQQASSTISTPGLTPEHCPVPPQ